MNKIKGYEMRHLSLIKENKESLEDYNRISFFEKKLEDYDKILFFLKTSVVQSDLTNFVENKKNMLRTDLTVLKQQYAQNKKQIIKENSNHLYHNDVLLHILDLIKKNQIIVDDSKQIDIEFYQNQIHVANLLYFSLFNGNKKQKLILVLSSNEENDKYYYISDKFNSIEDVIEKKEWLYQKNEKNDIMSFLSLFLAKDEDSNLLFLNKAFNKKDNFLDVKIEEDENSEKSFLYQFLFKCGIIKSME